MRPGKPAIVSDPVPPAQRGRRMPQRDRRRPVAASAATSTTPATASSGAGPGAASASTAWPIRRCAAPTSCSTRPACWRRSRRCASGCRSARRRCATAWRMVELPGRFQIVPGQPTLVLDVAHNPHAVADAGAQPGPDGLLPAHPRGLRRDARQGHRGACWRAWRRWSTTGIHRPAAAARGNGRRTGAALRGRAAGAGHGRARGLPRTTRCRPCAPRSAAADPADRIVVFGSFLTVGGVLQDGLPRLRPHTRLNAGCTGRGPFDAAASRHAPRSRLLQSAPHGPAVHLQAQAEPPAPRRAADAGDCACSRRAARARQRLVGAVVLVGIGIIGFPLLFETQPRPIPVDIPIEIPRKRRRAAAAMPPAAPLPRAVARRAGARRRRAPQRRRGHRASRIAGAPVVRRAAAAAPARAAPRCRTAHERRRAGAEPTRRPQARGRRRRRTPAGSRAKPTRRAPRRCWKASAPRRPRRRQAAEPRASSCRSAPSPRPRTAREPAQKVEKLGLKTYTQVTETAGGKRTRVRVGPLSARATKPKAARARSRPPA